MTHAIARAWWAACWVYWAIRYWLPWKAKWCRYFVVWQIEARWQQPRLHRRMWRHYQRTGNMMVTDR